MAAILAALYNVSHFLGMESLCVLGLGFAAGGICVLDD